MTPLRRPVAHSCRLMDSLSGSAWPWRFVFAFRAPDAAKSVVGPGSLVQPALPLGRLVHTDAIGTSQVSWRPVLRLCPALRPRRNRRTLTNNGSDGAAPGPNKAKASAVHDFEAAAGLQRALSTLHERRCRRPCKTRFRPAGSDFTGRELNPLGRDERFRLLHPSSFPGLILTQAGSIGGASSSISPKRAMRRSRRKRSPASPSSTPSKPTSVGGALTSAALRGANGPIRSSMRSSLS